LWQGAVSRIAHVNEQLFRHVRCTNPDIASDVTHLEGAVNMRNSRYVFAAVIGLALTTASASVVAQNRGYGYRIGDPTHLTGTYQLDRAQSDNPTRVLARIGRSLPAPERDRVMNRLEAPDQLSIELRGRQVTIMSSNAPQLTFQADGRDRTEPGPGGRMMTTHADVYGDELTVTTSGIRGNDFTARFEPTQNGLRVTRQIDSDSLPNGIVASSVYRRVSPDPRWNLYAGNNYGGPGRGVYGGARGGGVVVPDNTQITARLDRRINTSTARQGEHFTLTVEQPGVYSGAQIDGIVARTNRRSGYADMVFDFDSIRLRNGRTGDFEGQIESVILPNGQQIRVDRSNVVRDRDRGNSVNLGDAAVGAGLGAILGAIVGGGKGAAIGAAIGGGGTLIVEGMDNMDLPAGTRIMISSFGR
jgi:hypothetical protein